MKMELRIEGKVLIIEAEGVISLEMREAETKEETKPSLRLLPPVAPAKAPAPVPEVSPVPVEAPENDGLFARLASLRRELAAASGVPPYVVFQDRALHEMVSQMPQTLAEMGQISGVGAAKLEKYGDKFLALIRAAA